MSPKRTTCSVKICRKYKHLDGDGKCPNHTEEGNQKVSTCKQCQVIVNDNEKAIECDLCETWYHISCIGFETDLYEKITDDNVDSASDNNDSRPSPVYGIKWFCLSCLTFMENFLKRSKQSVDAELQTDVVEKGTQFNSIRTPVCEEYKHGSCVHGLKGTREIDGKVCDFKHPKKCLAYCKFGNDYYKGCNTVNCKFFHPIICRNSMKSKVCIIDNCTYSHLVGTRRKAPNYQPVNNPKQRDHAPYRSKRNEYPINTQRAKYSNFDANKLGFYGYRQQYQDGQYQAMQGADFQGTGDRQEYTYQEQDFPQIQIYDTNLASKPTHSANNVSQNNSYSNPNLNENFLDIITTLKTIQATQTSFQQAQTSFQQELYELKQRLQPQLSQHPQNQNQIFPVNQTQRHRIANPTQINQLGAFIPQTQPNLLINSQA